MKKEELKSKKGITLIALVVTIVVLLILAGTTINMLFSDQGIIKKAQEAADAQREAAEKDQQAINDLGAELNRILEENKGNSGGGTSGGGSSGEGSGTGSGGSGSGTGSSGTKVADLVGKAASSTNQDVTDVYGNKITIPAGFTVVANGTSNVSYTYTGDGKPAVQDGIVIQNATDGNQFVWVPVGTINNKSEDSRGTTTTIKLGRYSDFTVTNGVLPNPAQEATTSSYNTPVAIDNNFFEVSNTFAGVTINGKTYNAASSYGNTKAYNLQEWISKSLAKGGYYIARYEASHSEGDSTKAASKSGKKVWVNIKQPNAAIAARKTYSAVDGVNKNLYYSDLVNSYAWDTAIVFIEAYADSNYASDNNSNSFTTTGGNSDQVCNINDMSGNAYEWTTETSTNSSGSTDYPCTERGGFYDTGPGGANDYTSNRDYRTTESSSSNYSFRATLCVK